MNLQGQVIFCGQVFKFEILLHFSQGPEDLKMEALEFYQKWAKIPQGDHYEMEIVKLPVEAENVKLHIHPVGQKRFVCWTEQISTIESAKTYFKSLVLGLYLYYLSRRRFCKLSFWRKNSW
jgi:hypothetical protein